MNITHGLRRALQVNAGGLATVYGDRRRSWREIGDRVARLAGGLRSLGVAAGDRAAVLSLNSDRYLEIYLACAWAGAVIVPLNIRWTPAENQDVLQDCRPVMLIIDKAFAATGAALAEAIAGLRLVYADDDAAPAGMQGYEELIAHSPPVEDAMRASDDLAGIFYTGGTTGRSKGVMLSHGNLMANALSALAEGLFPGTATYLHAAPMFHLANGAAMFSILLSGGSNVVIKAFSAEAAMQAIERDKVTDTLLVPTMIHDGGYMDEDGFVYVVDRIKDMIISGGENVYSTEVENIVAQHPAIGQCAVIGIPSDRWGEQVHAVVVPKNGAQTSEDELIAFCKERLAGYKCPRSAEIRADPLPMSGAGKVLKRELRRPFWGQRERRVG